MASASATPMERLVRIAARTFTGLVLAYLVIPVFVVLPLSFTSGQLLVFPLPGWSMQWYRDFFTNPVWTGALFNSTVIGLVVTVVATTLGTLAALGLHGSKAGWKPYVIGLLVTPLAVPVVIFAVAIFYAFASVGLVGTYLGMILAHTVLALPFVVITVSATLQSFDPNLVRAAASLGASPARAFRTVTLPIIAPGVVSGALFAFVSSFDELVVALFLGSPQQRTLPRQIFSGVSENISPTITAAAVVLLVVSVALMGVMEALRRRGERLRNPIAETPA
jgi:putative spermidine/putrescine transport system permease protein